MFTVTGVTTSLLFLVANAVCKQTVVALAILDFAFVEECMETFACQVASVSGQCLPPLQRSQLSFPVAFTCAVALRWSSQVDSCNRGMGDRGNGFFKWTPMVSNTPSS